MILEYTELTHTLHDLTHSENVSDWEFIEHISLITLSTVDYAHSKCCSCEKQNCIWYLYFKLFLLQ